MWLDQDEYDNCPVCSKQLVKYYDVECSPPSSITCPTYHYVGKFLHGWKASNHIIFLDGDYIEWIKVEGGYNYCELYWQNKSPRKIDWLELESPVDLVALKNRIKKLLIFL